MLRLQLTGGIAWSNLRDLLAGTMTVPIEVDGESKRLPLSSVRNMAYSEDAGTRKQAYEAELAAYAQVETALAASLNALKGEALTFCEARQYDSLLDQTLEASRMDRQTLEALLEAMREALPDFRRYLKSKARLLGHPNGLPFYDLFAPMGSDVKTFSPEEARAYLVRVLGSFSEEMGAFVDRAFEERWIDLFPKEGKSGGAFCASHAHMARSWILTNFDGSFSAVGTLAHELGHAFHTRCIQDMPLLMSEYPMPLAETASIFNETFVSQHALKHAAPEEAFSLLEASLMDSTQVIVDIYSRYLFETEVVETCKARAMSVDELKDAMLRAQAASYGDGLDPDARHPYMWACKSHYYSTDSHFYNFPYAFGLLFGLGVYAQYEAQGAAYVPVYKKLLAGTTSQSIADVAASVGIDVRDVGFWRSSLDVIRKQIDQFVELADARQPG